MTQVELSYVKISYDAPILSFIYTPGTCLGVPELKEVVGIAQSLTGGKPYVTYSDVRQAIDMTAQGKKFLADSANMPFFRGSAIHVSTGFYSFAVNFATYFSKKTYPVKAFVTEEKAMEWLREQSLDKKATP